MRAAKLLLLCLIPAITVQCLPKTKRLVKTLWEKGDSYVAIAEFTDDPLAPYEHPARMEPELVQRALAALEYQEIAFFKWSKPKPAFKEDEAKLLGGYIAGALAEADANQVADFCISGRRTELIFPKTVLTCGLAFVKGGQLNLVFSVLLESEDDIEEDYSDGVPADARRVSHLKQKRIHASGPISYPPKVQENPLLRREHTNWAVVDLELLQALRPEGDIEKRLKKLKELYEKGLITEEEYQKKKEEMLKEL